MITYTCPDCGHEFDPHEVPHVITGPDVAYYTCPNCSNQFRAPPPPANRDEESEE
jgi:DNA-directed RNA polymerase subunit RPC12/RpoP